MMTLFAHLVCLVLAALTVQAQNTTVQVAVGGPFESATFYTFTPNNFTASNGTVISFMFTNEGNHSITQSSLASPCEPLEGGFDSGWVFIPATVSTPVVWNLTVTDDSKPLWFFCKQTLPVPHCPAGMFGGINANSSIMSTFATSAKSSSSSGQGIGALVGQGASASADPGPLPSGVTLFGTPSASGTPGNSTNTASSAATSTSSSAGFVVQTNSFLTLLAAMMGIALV